MWLGLLYYHGAWKCYRQWPLQIVSFTIHATLLGALIVKSLCVISDLSMHFMHLQHISISSDGNLFDSIEWFNSDNSNYTSDTFAIAWMVLILRAVFNLFQIISYFSFCSTKTKWNVLPMQKHKFNWWIDNAWMEWEIWSAKMPPKTNQWQVKLRALLNLMIFIFSDL